MCESEMYANVKLSLGFANASSTMVSGSAAAPTLTVDVLMKLRRSYLMSMLHTLCAAQGFASRRYQTGVGHSGLHIAGNGVRRCGLLRGELRAGQRLHE